jgi:methylmalonyl-CoA mutase
MNSEKLLEEFAPVSFDDWRQLVEAELKGAPFDKRMFTATYEGITLRPIYRQEDAAGIVHVNSFPGFAPFVRGTSAAGYAVQPWEISQEISSSSPAEFNHAARNSLSRGLSALNMVLDAATRQGKDPDWAQPEEIGHGGLSIATLADLDRALEGIDLERTSIFVRSGASAMPFAALLAALAKKRKKNIGGLRGCIEMDPLGVLAHAGTLPQSLSSAYDEMAALTGWAASRAPRLQTVCIHSRAWHEAGGSAVHELAFTLATAVDYFRAMNQRGLDVDMVAPRVRCAVTVGVRFFMEIAKLRALRMLWSRVVAALSGSEQSQKVSLHVRTSLWNKAALDPYNNLLRASVEAFAGVLGGCQSMQVGAFDEVARQPDEFSQRLARNTQLILQKECHLDHVIDPAGGSWYIECLTDELARRAWALLQEIEKQGGMESAMRNGFPQKTVAAAAAERIKSASLRRETIVGVNQYADAYEAPLAPSAVDPANFHKRRVQQVASHRTGLEDNESQAVLEKLGNIVNEKGVQLFEACVDAVSAGATLGEITRAIRINDSPGTPFTPVCITRPAAPFERLRAAANLFTSRTGHKPAVFLCNMGSLREHKARADFARGFFSAGGYEVISPSGFKSPEEAAKAFASSKASIAVICSTDENYPALVPPLAQALQAVRPNVILVLAGYPQDQIEAHKRAGVHEFIHLRADAVELLNRFHSKLGIT